ncbi:hemerythrin domain-containing protein [Microbulbifer halophilus]|uniref:Hemerythrin domain-containing protein n=1 Tax=Microbulbifer halophilus TaxID=453963 RepID=A0ABW5EA76_9GAMM|nr:hemerythrin domain-containing protein [Microbulbifer halophilus]MCW8125655.1 hemerythrin domain-containing protein [Microbulbifer halophilus]
MFSFITDLFRSDNANFEERYQRSNHATATGGRTISYDPTLVHSLKKDHATLVDLFQRIWDEGFQQRDFYRLAHLLTLFKSGFQAHLIKENVRFYVYLEQHLAGDVHTLQVVKDFRTDMNEIANAVMHFCKRYNHEAFSEQMLRSFERDYRKVGEALTRRVSLEEKELYILYEPA